MRDRIKQKAAQHASYLRNKETIISRTRSRTEATKKWYREYMAGKCCTFCAESTFECLDWHHVDPSTKSAQISDMVHRHRPEFRILEEMDKCILVCANCHRKLHAGLLS